MSDSVWGSVAAGAMVPATTFQGGVGPVGYAPEPQQQLQVQFGPLSPDGLPTQPALQDQTGWEQHQQMMATPDQMGVARPMLPVGPVPFPGSPGPALMDGS